jgi:hypothetical protein
MINDDPSMIDPILSGSSISEFELFDLSNFLLGVIIGIIMWNTSERQYEKWKLGQEI